MKWGEPPTDPGQRKKLYEKRSLYTQRSGSSFCLRHRSDAGLHLAGQVRHKAKHPLDQHQLCAVVHLMFLDPEDHLKACLARGRHTWRHRHALTEEVVRDAFEPAGEPVAFFSKQLDYLSFTARLFFHRHDFAEEGEEVESFERSTLFNSMDALGGAWGHGNMDEQLGNRAGFRGSAVAVLRLRNIFGDQNGIFADGTKTVGEFFSSVVGHSYFC